MTFLNFQYWLSNYFPRTTCFSIRNSVIFPYVFKNIQCRAQKWFPPYSTIFSNYFSTTALLPPQSTVPISLSLPSVLQNIQYLGQHYFPPSFTIFSSYFYHISLRLPQCAVRREVTRQKNIKIIQKRCACTPLSDFINEDMIISWPWLTLGCCVKQKQPSFTKWANPKWLRFCIFNLKINSKYRNWLCKAMWTMKNTGNYKRVAMKPDGPDKNVLNNDDQKYLTKQKEWNMESFRVVQ